MPSRREAGELWEWTPAQMVAAALAPCPHHPPRGVLPRPLPARRHHPDGSRIRRPPSRERDIDAHFLSVDWSESLFPFFPIRMQKKVFLLELIDYLFQLAWWSTLCVVLDPGRQSACAGVGPAATFFPPPPTPPLHPASQRNQHGASFLHPVVAEPEGGRRGGDGGVHIPPRCASSSVPAPDRRPPSWAATAHGRCATFPPHSPDRQYVFPPSACTSGQRPADYPSACARPRLKRALFPVGGARGREEGVSVEG